MAHPIWPPFDLEVHTPTMSLLALTDDRATELMCLAARGVHDPSFMPFSIPWTDHESPELERQGLQFHWRCRAEMGPERWALNLAAVVDGVIIGTTGLMAEQFAVTRTFESGSWLGREYQGRGLGKEMRRATLHLGFAGLGAEVATTGAFTDNGASLGVTRSLGYAPNGTARASRRGALAEIAHFAMTREHWQTAVRRDDIELRGVDPVREMLAIS